ncbi:NADP-dependent oxidoreductase [Gryllotalpicola reticulitermitis]|uniref:NADP-dependent oxidoreductase n=1 Tax=Gryllotalpicola reticulitermitis TaxID=1184153 RepID=A0ABV8QBN9_9MICO
MAHDTNSPEMIAVHFDRHGGPSVLQLARRRVPAPAPGTVLIHVRAAGISPVDLALRAGSSALTVPLPHVPGLDAAGTVVAVGEGVTSTGVGDEIYGSVALTDFGGSTAEYAILSMWAAKPAAMPWEQAGAAGTSVETATRALDLLQITAGDTVLIDGAAGGVGAIAAQLATGRGARVIGTARAETLKVVEARPGVAALPAGADLAHELRTAGLGAVDAALDASGAGVLPALIALTGDAERVVTIADFNATQYGVKLTRGALAGEADGRMGLTEAAELVRRGRFTVPIRGVFPFTRAADAHRLAEARPRWGKVVLINDQPPRQQG